MVGKGENVGNQHFSPFPTMFSILSKTNLNFWVIFILSSAKALNLDQSKILSFGKELNIYKMIQIWSIYGSVFHNLLTFDPYMVVFFTTC